MIRLLTGDVRDMLATLPDASVQCCVTSPPYFGLRDYGTAQWEGGDAGCGHAVPPTPHTGLAIAAERSDGKHRDESGTRFAKEATPYRAICGKCGARRIDRQLGLEPTPEAYLATMVQVFRDVRRVLRDDGTCWVNMGDAYVHGMPSGTAGLRWLDKGNRPQSSYSTAGFGLAAKQLLMMPARLALALQADGWWLRSDIIWSKPNPMPESVTDRPTSAHEHVFLLTKAARYFYDADAVREPHDDKAGGPERFGVLSVGDRRDLNAGVRPNGICVGQPRQYNPAGRNLRNVWTIATAPFPAAHFATFPPELAERCIRAGTSEKGACPQCGAPWYRVVDRGDLVGKDRGGDYRGREVPASVRRNGGTPGLSYENNTIGWHPTCGCDKCGPPVPCVVLDPFSGAGTALLVADRLGRDAIGIDLNADYVSLAKARLEMDAGLFSSVVEDPLSTESSPATPLSNGNGDITLLDLIESATLNSAKAQCDAH